MSSSLNFFIFPLFLVLCFLFYHSTINFAYRLDVTRKAIENDNTAEGYEGYSDKSQKYVEEQIREQNDLHSLDKQGLDRHVEGKINEKNKQNISYSSENSLVTSKSSSSVSSPLITQLENLEMKLPSPPKKKNIKTTNQKYEEIREEQKFPKLVDLLTTMKELNSDEYSGQTINKNSKESSFIEENSSSGAAALLNNFERISNTYSFIENELHNIRNYALKKFGVTEVTNKDTKEAAAITLHNLQLITRANTDPYTGAVPSDIEKRYIRPDLAESDESYFKDGKHLGLGDEAYAARITVEEYKKTMKIYGLELEDPPSPLPPNLGNSGCHPNNRICDRREIEESCEANIPVEDQGYCGSCWAFANGHQYSIYQCQKTGKIINFSKQQQLDCSGYHCGGGFQAGINKWLQAYQHWASEEEYPYEGEQKKCRASFKKNSWLGEIIDSYSPFSSRIVKDEKTSYEDWIKFIKQIVSHFGSVVIHVSLNIRFAGFVPMKHCEKLGDSMHAVLLTGWNVDSRGKEYFIFRNSWNKWYGKEGYGHMYIDAECEEGKLPFFSIEAPLIKDKMFSTKPKSIANIPYYSDFTSWRYNTLAHIDCSRKNKTITILSATFGSDTFFTKHCYSNVTQQVKNYCETKDYCSVEIPKVKKKPECADTLYLQAECGVPEKTYIEEEKNKVIVVRKLPEIKKKFQNINCNKAKRKSGSRATDGLCVQYCTELKKSCGILTLDCIERESERTLKLELGQELQQGSEGELEEESKRKSEKTKKKAFECDFTNTIDNGRSINKLIDCSLATKVGNAEVSKAYCPVLCEISKKKHHCEDNDMDCLTRAFRSDGHISYCNIMNVWISKSTNSVSYNTNKKAVKDFKEILSSTNDHVSDNYGSGDNRLHSKRIDCNAARLYPEIESNNSNTKIDETCIHKCIDVFKNECKENYTCFINKIGTATSEEECNLHAATTGESPRKQVFCQESTANDSSTTDDKCKEKCFDLHQCQLNDYLCYIKYASTSLKNCKIPWKEKQNCSVAVPA